MKKNLMLCALLLSVLLSGCAAEPLQGQTVGNTPKAPTPQEEAPAFFEPVSTDSSAPAKAPTEAADPAACTSNEDKQESGPAISSEPVSAPTESNAPASEEAKQPPVLPEKPEKTECSKEEPSVPVITKPEPTPEPEPAFDMPLRIPLNTMRLKCPVLGPCGRRCCQSMLSKRPPIRIIPRR